MPCLTGSKETSHCFLQLSPWQRSDPVPQVWMVGVCFESTQCSDAPQLHVSLHLLGMSGILRSRSIMFFFVFVFYVVVIFLIEKGGHFLLPSQHFKSKQNTWKYKQVRECPKQDALCCAIRVRSQIQARLSWPPLRSTQCAQRNESCMQFAVGCS